MIVGMKFIEMRNRNRLFLKQLREQFSCAKYTNCEIKGGKVIAFFNRYEKVNEIWCKFKAKLQHFGY
jgi:hypothetical protein